MSSPQGLPPPWAPGEPAQWLQPSSEVCSDHRPGSPDTVLPADHHEGAAWVGRCDPSLCPRPLGLGGGEPASPWWSPVGLWSSLCGVSAGQSQRSAPDCGGLPIQDWTGQGWRGCTHIRIPGKDNTLSNVVLLILKVISVQFYHFLQTQLSPVSKGTYREYLGKLDLQYGKLLVNSFLFQTFVWG